MDIRKWLSETVLPQQPPSPLEQRGEHPPARPRGLDRIPVVKRRRKQSTSDSSMLDAAPQRKKRPPSGRVPSPEEKVEEAIHTDASHPASRSYSSISSEPYRRKPRRKTRRERYEPMPKHAKERGLHTQRHGKDESKRARRKSRRIKSGSGRIPSFQAKNVPRDRLTLKPREKLGLFNKGRVSSPVKGRGLPDLVFSEMRFLQKHKTKAEVGPHPESPRKKQKRDQAHAKEDEISAYFTSVRPVLAKQDTNVQTKEPSRQRQRDAHPSQRESSSIVDRAILTVEPADQIPYLGFGGRGLRQESGSYISWSDSARIPSVTPAHVRIEAANSNIQLGSMRGGKTAGKIDGGEGKRLHSPTAPPITTKHLVNDKEGRFQSSSLPPTHERLSRSYSLPHRSSSPRRINLVDRAARRPTLEEAASPSSLPPLISMHSHHRRPLQRPHARIVAESRDHCLSVQHSGHTMHRDTSLDLQTELRPHDDPNQRTSSSLGRILQECNTAFHEKRIAEVLQPNVRELPSKVPAQSNMGLASEIYPTIRRIPSVRFAGLGETYCPTIPAVSGPIIYEQQEERLYRHADRFRGLEGSLPVPRAMQDEDFDEEVIDYAEQGWDDENELADYDVGFNPIVDDTDTRQMDISIADAIQGRASVVARPGFWRPNKLY